MKRVINLLLRDGSVERFQNFYDLDSKNDLVTIYYHDREGYFRSKHLLWKNIKKIEVYNYEES